MKTADTSAAEREQRILAGEDQERRILDCVRRQGRGGVTCEELAVHVGALPALVSVVLRGMRKAGLLKSKGNTRGTKWRVA